MRLSAPCPVCGNDYRNAKAEQVEIGGQPYTLQPTFMGGESWSDYALLRLMQQEWSRPLPAEPVFPEMPDGRRPSPRLLLVILYWSMFEAMVTRLLEAAMRDLPPRVAADLLSRYGAIGARLDRLYRILFDTSFWSDLRAAGHEPVARHLAQIQERRNAFIHGDPQAIGDDLVKETVEMLPLTIDAWVAVYNKRCTRPGTPSGA